MWLLSLPLLLSLTSQLRAARMASLESANYRKTKPEYKVHYNTRAPESNTRINGSALLNRYCVPSHSVQQSDQLQRLCRRKPEVALIALFGLQEAVRECQHQMRFHRWDCALGPRDDERQSAPFSYHEYTPSMYVPSQLVLDQPPITKYGYAENAFLLSLSSAGISWSISRACLLGRLPMCTCDRTQETMAKQNWKWAGCAYPVRYGLQISRKVLGFGDNPDNPNVLNQFYKHNLKAGRQTIRKTIEKHCRCHGVSGSCSLKSCWKATANLRQIGSRLKEKYETPHNMLPGMDSRLYRFYRYRRSKDRYSHARSTDLVYYQKSPSFCRESEKHGSLGTQGRVCGSRNDTSGEAWSHCGRLCCGRGNRVEHIKTQRQCNCKFVWCCEVKCQHCIDKIQTSICN